MTNQITKNSFRGEVNLVKGNELILLDDSQTIWLVQSGSMDLFSVSIKDGEIEGNRHYLFSCKAGSALFGTTKIHDSIDRQMVAVSTGNTGLLRLDPQSFEAGIASAAVNTTTLIEGWLNKFDSKLFGNLVAPSIQVKADQARNFSLTKGTNWQPSFNNLLWVEAKEGVMLFLGKKELVLTPRVKFFPITRSLWLESYNSVQFTAKTTESIVDVNHLLEGLSIFHRQFLFCHQEQLQQKYLEETKRLNNREKLDQQVTVKALGELTSPLRSRRDDIFVSETPLLAAAGAVGRTLGMEISPPKQSENLERLDNPLEAVARASHLRMRQVLLRDNWWKKDCGPLVGYIKQQDESQPVALLPVSKGYELYNPSDQSRNVVDANTAREINPVAYMFYRSFPNQALSIIDILRFAFKGRARDLLIIVFSSIAITLLGMLTPQATAILIDSAIPNSDRASLIQIGVGLTVAAMATALFRLAQGFSLLRIETASDAATQAAMWDRLLNLPVSFFRQYTTGDLLSRTNSVSHIRKQLGSTILIKLITSVFALLNLGLLFYYSVPLAAIAVGAAVIIILVTSASGSLLVRKVRPLLEIEGNIFGEVVQLINGISKLRVAGAQQRAFAFWSKSYSRQVKLELSTQLIEDLVAVFNTVMPMIVTGLLFWFTITLLDKAQIGGQPGLTVGTFLAFNSAFGTFIIGATQVSNIVTDILQVVPQWQRAQPIITTLPEVNLANADPGRLSGRITIERLSFRYTPDIPLTLENISINIEPGEFIALVGGSGSGKSTIFRLLLGFEISEDGSIYYDGQDLAGLDVSAVRRQLGVVLQNGSIMAGSIFDNLAGNARVSLDEAWEAARMAGFDSDINSMPMGMHTVVSEGGGNFSGGQRQRLLIAKALVLKPRILLFDEATSALDNKTQAIVSRNLEETQVTRIVIAHRLSTIRNADRIYVLDKGKILQQGNFEKLSSEPGKFFELAQRQIA